MQKCRWLDNFDFKIKCTLTDNGNAQENRTILMKLITLDSIVQNRGRATINAIKRKQISVTYFGF